MTEVDAVAEKLGVVIKIGGIPICVNTTSSEFAQLLANRYEGFISDACDCELELDVELTPGGFGDPAAEVHVSQSNGRWQLTRGDFRAEWEPAKRRGHVKQSSNPYSIDSVLRILHTLILARGGGLLLHSASAIRNGKAFLFAGVSGAGKTTISRLAPPDATLLTDEISYLRKTERGYLAFGTPFTGELAKVGENVSAPVGALFLLAQGPQNRIDEVPAAEAGRALLANVLFFAQDPDLVQVAFHSALDFAASVPVRRLTFVPDERVWEFIG